MKKSMIMLVLAGATAVCAEAKPAFYLPGTVYAAPGLECNIYYKNIIQSVVPQNFSYQAQSKVGTGKLIRWHWTPKEKDAGTTNQVVINAWNDDGIVASLTTKVVVASAPKDPKKKVAFALFADSLTNGGYPNVICQDVQSAGCSNFVSIGTHGGPHRNPKERPDVWHEGIPGYTCSQFLLHCHVTEDELKSAVGTPEYELYKHLGAPKKIGKDNEYDRRWVRSPLIREENGRPVLDKKGKPVVDIQMWLDKVNGGQPADVVMVQLGVNDVFWLKGEQESLRKQIRGCVMPWYAKFLETLQAKMPKAHFVFTTQPMGSDQDAFGENYGSDWNEIQHRKIMFALNKEVERFVAGRNDPRVHLLSLAQQVDPFYGFCYWNMPINARCKDTKARATNAVHVSGCGGSQMADTMAAWVLAHWNSL